MDLQFWWMIIKIIVFLPFIIFLIYASIKYGGSKLQTMQNGSYIKVLERTHISKENSLLAVKIGEKGYIIASTNGRIEIICELDKEEILKIEQTKTIPEYKNLKDFYEKTGLERVWKKANSNLVNKKLNLKKEDKNE